MKREPPSSLENADPTKSAKLVEENKESFLNFFVTRDSARDYYLLKQLCGEQFIKLLENALFNCYQEPYSVKSDNAFYRAFHPVGSSAVTQGVPNAYSYQLLALRENQDPPSINDLEPFVFTLVYDVNHRFRALVNRLGDNIDIEITENLFSEYSTLDLRSVSSSRLIDKIGRNYAIPTEHYIYHDILESLTPTLAFSLLETVPYKQLCSAMGVARVSFLQCIFDVISKNNRHPVDMICKDNYLLVRDIIYGGAFNRYHTAIDTKEKLSLIFEHIKHHSCMQPNHIVSTMHLFLHCAIQRHNHVAISTLLSKVTDKAQRKELFEYANFQLFIDAFNAKNVSTLMQTIDMLEDSRKKKILSLAFLLAHDQISQYIDCLERSRKEYQVWIASVLKRTQDSEVITKAKELQEEIQRVQDNNLPNDVSKYQFTQCEMNLLYYLMSKTQADEQNCLLYPPEQSKSEEHQNQIEADFKFTTTPLQVTDEILECVKTWIAEKLPEVMQMLNSISEDEWEHLFTRLFDVLSAAQHSACNWIRYRYYGTGDQFYQELLRAHIDITDIERRNFAVQQYMSKNDFSTPLWSHQLDLVYRSKISAKNVYLMGTQWHGEILRALNPMYVSCHEVTTTNFAIIKMSFVGTTVSGQRLEATLPISYGNDKIKYCPPIKEIKPIYQSYKLFGQSLINDQHRDDDKNDRKNILHSEKLLVYLLHGSQMIKKIADFIQQHFRQTKLRAIVLDIVSTNQCCKTCHLMLLGLQNSQNMKDGFLNNLVKELQALGVALSNKNKAKKLCMITRYSSFQPMNTLNIGLTGDTPDNNYVGKSVSILHSNSHIQPGLSWCDVSNKEMSERLAQQARLDRQNTIKSIVSVEKPLNEKYGKKHQLNYCGYEPLSVEELCSGTEKLANPVVICAPNQSTQLYLMAPPVSKISLAHHTLFCSGCKPVSKLDEEWGKLCK